MKRLVLKCVAIYKVITKLRIKFRYILTFEMKLEAFFYPAIFTLLTLFFSLFFFFFLDFMGASLKPPKAFNSVMGALTTAVFTNTLASLYM